MTSEKYEGSCVVIEIPAFRLIVPKNWKDSLEGIDDVLQMTNKVVDHHLKRIALEKDKDKI